MYMKLDDYTSYSETMPSIFETKNYNITCIHGYPKSLKIYRNITWVNKGAYDTLYIF